MDNFTPTINSDNRFHSIVDDNTDSIIIGGSCTHLFKLPFSYSAYAKSAEVIYKQGLEVKLEIAITSSMIYEDEFNSLIRIDLGPIQTQNFDCNCLDTFAQLKIVNKADEVMYDEPKKIRVTSPLKVNKVFGGEE